jgi:hypothetical protein
MNGDTQNPNSIYLYDAAALTWSQQATTPGGFDIGSSTCILDHDTNVYCTQQLFVPFYQSSIRSHVP